MDTALRSPRHEVLAELKHRLAGSVRSFEPSAEEPSSVLSWWKPGTIGEFLCDRPGSGAAIVAWCSLFGWLSREGVCAVVDGRGECCAPAVAAWGCPPSRLMILRPNESGDAWWAVEQCLRSRAVAATCAWVERAPERLVRRWQLAAEKGGGVGLFFRPAAARREPSWAEFRVLVTPHGSAQGERRRLRVEMLYRRGGLGGSAQVWEIDHAQGVMQLVPAVANPTVIRSATGA